MSRLRKKKDERRYSILRWRSVSPSFSLVLKTLALGLVLGIALTACGNDTSNSTTAAPSAAGTTAGAAGTTAGAAGTTAGAAGTTAGAAGTTATGGVNITSSGPAATTAATTRPASTNVQQQAAVTNSATSTSITGTSNNVTPTGNLETDIRSVVKAVKPAVVLIAVTTPQAQGVGTGSIITPDGFILTNFHVVAADGATVSAQTKIQVVMIDGKKLTAKVVGTDRSNDLAVIKIDGSTFPTIKLGSSSALQIGDWVVAVGNALALPGGPTVTSGIVGALGRSIQEPPPASANLTDLIQTNAAINPGNSGGPLLNLNGEIVGINTAAPVDPQSQSAAQGIGFAISIDQAKPIIDTLKTGTSIVLPYLGILPETLTPGLAAQYNLSVESGILIRQVGPGTPAAKAGWKAGDVLTQLDGTKMSTLVDLQGVLSKHKPGDTVKSTLITPQGQTQQVNITFGTPPNQ